MKAWEAFKKPGLRWCKISSCSNVLWCCVYMCQFHWFSVYGIYICSLHRCIFCLFQNISINLWLEVLFFHFLSFVVQPKGRAHEPFCPECMCDFSEWQSLLGSTSLIALSPAAVLNTKHLQKVSLYISLRYLTCLSCPYMH